MWVSILLPSMGERGGLDGAVAPPNDSTALSFSQISELTWLVRVS